MDNDVKSQQTDDTKIRHISDKFRHDERETQLTEKNVRHIGEKIRHSDEKVRYTVKRAEHIDEENQCEGEEIQCDGKKIRQIDEEIRHTGGCHCGAVRYEVYAPRVLRCFRCNCSICTKKQHIIHTPVKYFKLLQGKDSLTTYTFNTHQAKHIFCKVCTFLSFHFYVQSFKITLQFFFKKKVLFINMGTRGR